jgi:hypothetical protein
MFRPYRARGVSVSIRVALLFGELTTRTPRGVVAPSSLSFFFFLASVFSSAAVESSLAGTWS